MRSQAHEVCIFNERLRAVLCPEAPPGPAFVQYQRRLAKVEGAPPDPDREREQWLG